ncbi:MAG: sigma-70 family RNA polymerase sigma factor [Candidatus Dormibacteraeota bacterium]|nr:sigma-70 family RNA polymerase sigma factor [Candidatus Dormibacteraeota bacterium]
MAELGFRRTAFMRSPAKRERDRGERDLILRAQRYEADALADLFDGHFDGVYRYVHTLVGDHPATEEIVRRVFLRALEGLPRYRRYESGFATWLERIANAVLSESARPAGTPAPMPATDLPEETRLREAIRGLTPDQLDVLGLRFVAGLPADAVAKATGRGMGRVQALQHRALLALRRALAGEPEPASAEVAE